MDTRQQHNKAVSTDEWYTPRFDGEGITRFDGYPDHISNGGWAFYALKMIAVLIGLAVMIIGWV